ncbi:MAG: NfeD family protein [Chloroflexota bacterium]|nr:NfeD family protein [Chloroflexota bacterium]
MPVRKKKSAYTLYSLVRTLFDEAALAALGLWLLPRLGVNVPVWFLAAFMVAWAVYSLLTSRLVAKVVDRAAAVGAETLIGVKCTTITPLSPYGYVRVGSELWRACAIAGDIYAGAEVVIEGINGLTLLVKPSMEVSFDEAAHTSSETGMSCAQNKGSSQCSVLQMSLQSLSFRT